MKPSKSFRLKNYRYPDHFGKLLGYRVEKVDYKKHRAKVYVQIQKRHLSSARRVHGGVVSAFLDFACGAAVFTTLGPHDFCSTVELKVNYLKPLLLGDRLVAETEVMFRGKNLCVVRGVLHARKVTAALVTATFNIVDGSRLSAAPSK